MRQLSTSRLIFAGLMALILLQFPVSSVFGIGQCREVVCPCSKEDQDKIDGLIGRLHALKEVADLTRTEYNEAVKKRNKARDNIWGADGSLKSFSESLLMVAANTPGGTGKGKVVREALAWAGTGKDILTSPGEGSTWAGTGAQVIGSDAVMDQRAVKKVFYAAEKATDFYRKTGSPGISAKVFYEYARGPGYMRFTKSPNMGPIKKFGNFVSVGMAVGDFYQDTESLAKDLPAYFEARQEAKQLQAQLDRIDEQIEEVLKQLEELRKRCPLETPPTDAPKKSSGTRSGLPLLVSESRDYSHPLAPGAPRYSSSRLSPSASNDVQEDARLEAALNKIIQLQRHLDRVHARLWDKIIALHLSPFIVGAWREMPLAVLWEMAHDAVPDLNALPDELEQAVTLGNEVAGMLKVRALDG